MILSYSKGVESFTSKPNWEVEKKLHFIGVNQPITNLIYQIEKGYSFLCGTFEWNHRTTERFMHQQIFGVDFDSGVSINEAGTLLNEYDLQFTIGYPTFSHTNHHPRFRLLFALDGLITDPELASDINHSLIGFFKDYADKACSDLPRVWYGSNQSCFGGDSGATINTLQFLDSLNQKIYSSDHNKRRNCIDINRIINACCPETGNVYRYNKNSSFQTSGFPSPMKDEGTPNKLEKWNIEDLLQFEIFKRFYNGEGGWDKPEKLSHRELFGIATNMMVLSGGEKKFKELLSKNSNYKRDKYSITSYIKDRYEPMLIDKFSQFPHDKNSPYKTFEQALKKRGKITVYSEPIPIPLEQAEKELKVAFENIMAADDHNVYLVKCAPGLGKSEFIKNLKNVVLAFPDHALKDEQFQTSKLSALEKVFTPNIKGRFSSAVEKRFEAYYETDMAKNVSIELKLLSAGNTISPNQVPEDAAAAQEFMNDLTYASLSNQSVFTTHIRALHQEWTHNTICFDESPIGSIIQVYSAKVEELETVVGYLIAKGIKAEKLINLLEQPDFETPKETPKISIKSKVLYSILTKQKFKSQVIKFFSSKCYFIENGFVHYCIDNSKRFKNNKKYIICDATASIELYKHIFGDRLRLIDISNVQNTGSINQYTTHSCSKSGLEKYGSKLVYDKSLPTIGFKEMKNMFENAAPDVHFGRVRGSNAYAGKDINVVGTPHYNNTYFKFLAFLLHIENTEWKMQYQQVDYEGRCFQFMTYRNAALQRIHLEAVEAELLQAVHRARILRYPCVVNLYSNFPLLQAQYIY